VVIGVLIPLDTTGESAIFSMFAKPLLAALITCGVCDCLETSNASKDAPTIIVAIATAPLVKLSIFSAL
jgi:hypothetical protein